MAEYKKLSKRPFGPTEISACMVMVSLSALSITLLALLQRSCGADPHYATPSGAPPPPSPHSDGVSSSDLALDPQNATIRNVTLRTRDAIGTQLTVAFENLEEDASGKITNVTRIKVQNEHYDMDVKCPGGIDVDKCGMWTVRVLPFNNEWSTCGLTWTLIAHQPVSPLTQIVCSNYDANMTTRETLILSMGSLSEAEAQDSTSVLGNFYTVLRRQKGAKTGHSFTCQPQNYVGAGRHCTRLYGVHAPARLRSMSMRMYRPSVAHPTPLLTRPRTPRTRAQMCRTENPRRPAFPRRMQNGVSKRRSLGLALRSTHPYDTVPSSHSPVCSSSSMGRAYRQLWTV
jgi:hypothetical protein